MKACTRCGEKKPSTEFYGDNRVPDGLQSQCKVCMRLASSKWYAANPDKEKERQIKYRSANSDKVKARMKKWYAENQDSLRAKASAWQKANPEACRIYSHTYRTRKQENGGSLSHGITEKLYKLQRGKCACCGLPLGDNYHLDHIMPIFLGGKNTDSNVQLLRSTCNLQKSARHPVDFMQSRGFLL